MRLAVSVLFLLFAQPVAAQAAAPDAAPLFAAGLWDVRDEPTSLAGLRGRALIVNFWARWCGPCRAEIPEFVAAHRGLKGENPLVVGIALEEHGQTVREFAKVYEMDYLLLLARDRGQPLMRALGNPAAALPYMLVIDRAGRIVSRKQGVISRPELEQAIASVQ